MPEAPRDPWAPVDSVIRDAIAARTFPAAVLEVGDSARMLRRAHYGTLTFEADAPPPDIISGAFDLASLTKPLATTLLVLRLERAGRLSLDEPIAPGFSDWRGADRAGVTIRDLLEHCGGLAPRLVDPAPASRREFEHAIGGQPLEYAPRTKAVYSDLGFILLGFLVEDRGGASLREQFAAARDEAWDERVHAEPEAFIDFGVPGFRRERTAPTRPLAEDMRRGTVLQGEVHDNYAAALGGAAGHAGLFGNASGVAAMARAWLRGARGLAGDRALLSNALVSKALARSRVPGSSRLLGWDSMLATSSCGPNLSTAAFGHVGFTGVSLWIDPVLDRYFVLLTNRVYGDGTSDAMQTARRAFHTAAASVR